MISRLLPESVTLNDLERRNMLRYFAEFGSFVGQLPVASMEPGLNLSPLTILSPLPSHRSRPPK